ncbi:hypothetical protein AB6D96_15135 [Vibrio cyclitrophicus]
MYLSSIDLSNNDNFFKGRVNLVQTTGKRYDKLKACIQGKNVKIRHSEFNDPNVKIESGDIIEVINGDVPELYSIISTIFRKNSSIFPGTHQLKISKVKENK